MAKKTKEHGNPLEYRYYNVIDHEFIYSSNYDCLFDFFGDYEFYISEYKVEANLERATGKKDKNGVMIYEGDRVRCGNIERDIVGPVRYSNVLQAFVVELGTVAVRPLLTFSKFEVVGDIHTGGDNA